MPDNTKNIREKSVGVIGSVSGTASILGSWQICHSLCMGLIALLGLVGITVTGMPFLFLTTIAVPLWIIAVILLGITALLYIKKKCISKNLIILNSGIILAGTPFNQIDNYRAVFWIIGGAIALSGIALMIKDKISKKKCARC